MVNPELIGAPGELGDLAKSERCREGIGRKVHETSRVVDSSVEPPLVSVPKLTEKMYPDP
ncbi:hypothetical protein A5740_24375 [Mycobacterium sp. GA-1841]|uniref:hypothetical protein n=1 Tax=Mycobacterium sp. GA-1841 TaxID=1834154 RepID=UPI00096C9B92|nr:hypothetical protein [Mycobacterium sp. GA-1841]OMC40158.1 hypothetical protein A5740_24375 [Mycobacterium sp. GA-1841]